MLCAVSLGVTAQVTYPYNPDGNADGSIALGDLLDACVYGNPFSPSEIMVDDSTLTSWIEQVSEILSQQQLDINDLVNWLEANVQEDFKCGEELEYHGYNYPTVQLGGNCWFAKNLSWLPEVFPPSDASESESRYYVYNYTGNSLEEAEVTPGYDEFGVYYNKYAFVNDSLCPSGWHLPTIYEWRELLYTYAHPDYWSTPEFYGCRDLMHEDYNWDFSGCPSDCGLVINGTGFSIKAHNKIYQYPDYFGAGGNVAAYFGAAEPDGHLYFYGNQIYLNPGWQNGTAYPARCIKDTE